MGRPTIYRPEYPRLAMSLARGGYTDSRIAEALRVGAGTFCEWKTAHPELADALHAARGEPAPAYPKPDLEPAAPPRAPRRGVTLHSIIRPWERKRPTTAIM